MNMEFVQFHPTGMVWPPSVKGILVTESVRGDGGVLRNSEGKRFMFDYVPDVFRAQYAETEEEADRWYDDPDNNRRPPELLPRDEVARVDQLRGQGRPRHRRTAGSSSTSPPGCPAEEILRRLPSMYHQFKELADVDITEEPMEVGPTCHYVMGGVEVDPDTAAATRARPVRGRRGLRRHARLQPARRQLAVRPAGLRPPGRAARRAVRRRPGRRGPAGADEATVEAAARRGAGPAGARRTARTRTRCTASCSRR